MWTYIIIYLLAGVLCFFTAIICAARKKVSSSMSESIIDPLLFVVVISLWPLFFLNDILLYIPKQRKERYADVEFKRAKARAERLTLRLKRDDYYAVVGKIGVASTDLRLTGYVRVGDQNWNAISENGFIPADSPIEVTDRKGNELLVKQLPT